MATTSPAAADVKYAFFGTKGNGDEQFEHPLGMAFNHDKTEIFVADNHNNRVQVLTYNRKTGELTFKERFTGNSHHVFDHPTGVAIHYDDENIIIVADTNNDHICGLNAESKTIVQRPSSVAFDKGGNIFAYDSSNCRIAIRMNNADTTNIKYICEKGEGKGEYKGDEQLGKWGTLAFDNEDNLVVADEHNNRVQVLNRNDGKHIRTITGIISDKRGGQLKSPCGIAFTDDGEHIIIADFGNNRVRVLTYPDGVIVESFGTQGTGNGEFDGPYGVLVDDENGRIIVSEETNHRIQVIHNAFPPKKLAKVEDNPLGPSKSKYPGLEDAIREAITAFSTSEGLGAAYANILNELNEKIDKDRKRINNPESHLSELLAKVTPKEKKEKTKGKKPTKKSEPKPVSQLKTKDEVKTFIGEKTDAIFVVTGGSFNPPHKGHIGMFQKAYDELMKVVANKDKTVYGVMVPATDKWIEDKICERANGGTCTPDQRKATEADIESKRIKLVDRVHLCKLSCDSFEWTDKGTFGAENMIVVNESGDGEQFTSPANTYYLCGSDYYKKSDTKFICVLRKGDVKNDTKLTRTKGGKPETIDIKATDIIIEGGEDNDASSTMLRNILTEISKFKISEDDTELPTFPDKDKKLLALISIPVLRRLLELKYILTDAENNKKVLEFMNIDLDAPDAKSSNDTDSKLKDKDGVRTNGSRSLCNIGSMCYMNAALQLVYSMTDFRTAIKTPTNQLTEYLTAMDRGVSCDQARVLAKRLYDFAQGTRGRAFTNRSFNEQEDAGELITTVLSANVFDTSKDSMRFNSSTALVYTGSEEIKTACIQLDKTALNIVPETEKTTLVSLRPLVPGDTLLLPVTDGATKLTRFKDVFDTYRNSSTDREEKVDDSQDALAGKNLSSEKNGIISNLPDCMMDIQKAGDEIISKVLKPGCNPLIGVEKSGSKYKLTHLKDKTYISIGPTQKYFIVILKRTVSNEKGTQTKLKHSVDLTSARIEIGGISFIITGCVCHHGPDSTSGHYTYVEFKDGNPTTVYDDHNIVSYATYLATVDRNRTVDTQGYVLLFEREQIK
jgi:DNA-binding beta-propeller fold protein YncE